MIRRAVIALVLAASCAFGLDDTRGASHAWLLRGTVTSGYCADIIGGFTVTNQLMTMRPGYIAGSGVNGRYLRMGGHANSPMVGVGEFTLMFTARNRGCINLSTIIGSVPISTSTGYVWYCSSTTNAITLAAGVANRIVWAGGAGTFQTGEWHNFAQTFRIQNVTQTVIVAYRDGLAVAAATNNYTFQPMATAECYMGSPSSGRSPPVDIRAIYTWSRALTDAEILANARAELADAMREP